jgi:phenylalanyl-tRNA synthetase beta chain
MKNVLSLRPPSYRFDIEIEEDLIEEVARLYGFERIPANPPLAMASMRPLPEGRRTLHDLRERLAASDYQEVINYSFVEAKWETDFAANADPIRLLNPIASQLAVMRSTLIGGLVANVRYNLNRKIDRVRVFEIGRAFLRDASVADGDLDVKGIRQPVRIAAAAFGTADEEQWGIASRNVDFFDIKRDVEVLCMPTLLSVKSAPHPALHPGRSARVLLDKAEIGWIGSCTRGCSGNTNCRHRWFCLNWKCHSCLPLVCRGTGKYPNFRLCGAIWHIYSTKKPRSIPSWMG